MAHLDKHIDRFIVNVIKTCKPTVDRNKINICINLGQKCKLRDQLAKNLALFKLSFNDMLGCICVHFQRNVGLYIQYNVDLYIPSFQVSYLNVDLTLDVFFRFSSTHSS